MIDSMRGRIVLIALILGMCAMSACAGSKPVSDSGEETVVLEGKISVTGNEPHTELTLASSGGIRYVITEDLTGLLQKKYQKQTVKVEAVILKEGDGPLIPAQIKVLKILD